jgi:hypothetical protein
LRRAAAFAAPRRKENVAILKFIVLAS